MRINVANVLALKVSIFYNPCKTLDKKNKNTKEGRRWIYSIGFHFFLLGPRPNLVLTESMGNLNPQTKNRV